MLGQNIATKKVNWISDADIKGFFDNVCHERLDELLRIRISDPKLLALICRFLRAGVMIEGQRFETEDGVPQGASLLFVLHRCSFWVVATGVSPMAVTLAFNLKRHGASRPVFASFFEYHHRTACAVPLKMTAIGREPVVRCFEVIISPERTT